MLQGSEKLWGAAAHSVMALAHQRGWKYGSHYALIQVVEHIADDLNDRTLRSEFAAAQKFHANFYHEFMDDGELDVSRPAVHRFVQRMLALVDDE